MALSVPTGKPGIGPSTYITTPRDIFYGQPQKAMYLPFPITIDGTNSYNMLNQPYNWLLWAGTMLGQITASKKFAPAILGLTTQALGGGQTTLQTDVNTATGITLRADMGSAGTLTVTGPPTPGGVTRSRVATYSAVNINTGAITITALNVAAVTGTNQVNSLVTVDSTGSGTFTLTVEGITTAAITYSATAATLNTNINAQLDATFGAGNIVSSGASLAAIILTGTAGTYAKRPIGLIQATILAGSTGYTLNGSGTVGVPSTCPVTTPGVVASPADSGEFIAGSLVQPNDGSQIIKTIIVDKNGTKVIDEVNTTRVDVFDGQLWAGGGVINTGYIVYYPTDPSLQAYIKAQIRSFVNWAVFSDDYIGN